MFRQYAFWCLYAVLLGGSQAFIEQFVYQDLSPKCCSQGEALTLVGSDNNLVPYECVGDVNRTSHVLTSEIVPSFPWSLSDETSCVDDIISADPDKRQPVKFEGGRRTDMHLNYFPKCCPFNAAYDLFEHKCVHRTNETDLITLTDEVLSSYLTNGLLFLRIGLSKCKSVIVDYELNSLQDISYQESKNIVVESLSKEFHYGSYCIDKVFDKETYVVRACHEDFDVCKKKKSDTGKPWCVRKCCVDGYYFKGGGQCKFGFTNRLNFFNDSKVLTPEEPFAPIYAGDCRRYIVPLDWDYTLNEVGMIKLNLEENQRTHSAFELGYCFEDVDAGVMKGRRLFLCFEHMSNESLKFQVSRIAFLLSCIFLILTLLGYMFLPEMQNLHGKTLMCNCASLLVAFLVLVVLQFYPTVEGITCTVVGYLVMYTFLAAFMWSNVMCFDIWWTFGSMRVHGIDQKKRERRKFIWYCIYAWSAPIPITVGASMVQYFKKSMPESMVPFIPTLGGFSCFFEESTNLEAFLTWFMLPIAVMSVVNLILFIKTVMYCYKVKNEIDKMKDSLLSKNERKKILSADKERLRMVTKLFLVMGIPWLFESISACTIPVDPEGAALVVEIVFDTINTLQGVYIFCIFILKTKFIRAVKKKLGGKYFGAPTSSASAATTSSYVPTSCKV